MGFAVLLVLTAAWAQEATVPSSLPALAAPEVSAPADKARLYLRAVPIPQVGLAGVGIAYAPGKGAVRPLVGAEVGVLWTATDSPPEAAIGLNAYVGARFLARPTYVSSFMAEVGAGVLTFPSEEFIRPAGRVALGYRRAGDGVHWDLLGSFVVVPVESLDRSSNLVPVPVPTVEFGLSF